MLVVFNGIALVLANANSYVWNTLWTFKGRAEHDLRQGSSRRRRSSTSG